MLNFQNKFAIYLFRKLQYIANSQKICVITQKSHKSTIETGKKDDSC